MVGLTTASVLKMSEPCSRTQAHMTGGEGPHLLLVNPSSHFKSPGSQVSDSYPEAVATLTKAARSVMKQGQHEDLASGRPGVSLSQGSPPRESWQHFLCCPSGLPSLGSCRAQDQASALCSCGRR